MKMTEREAKEYAKTHLEEYLTGRGIDTRRLFRCLNPAHPDRRPSMSFHNGRVKCFACGFSGDIFDLIALEENRSGRDVFRRTYELLGLDVDTPAERPAGKAAAKPSAVAKTAAAEIAPPPTVKAEPQKETETEDLTAYLASCAERIGQTDYFERRGIGRDVAARFGLGFDPAFRRGTGSTTWRAVVIPNGQGGYISRNTDPKADSRSRYRKAGSAAIFNSAALYEESERPVWIVEGEFDALSFLTVGFDCAALGSVANADKLLRMLENRPTGRRLILALDNDEAGRTCTQKLREGFARLKLEAMTAENVYGDQKDANAALVSDRAGFVQAANAAEEALETVIRAEEAMRQEEYEQTLSAYGHLDAFLGELACDTPCVPTGFPKLDTALGGGLYPGLMTVGAVSSLGKTTFCMQIADHIAAAGQDVLVFSLEMARYELMSRSISRITLEKTLAARRNVEEAKSARDITTSGRYNSYSEQELLLIDESVREYRETSARKVFILEGMGDVGAREIRAAVEEHVRATRRTPVVLVDYLQLMTPYSERMTDKQSTDRNVMELKRISRDFRTPVIAVSSFSRASYNSVASMSAFKESGGIEYSSDQLIALQYAGTGDEGFDLQAAMLENPRRIELAILKNRQGMTGYRLHYNYYPRYNFFQER